MDTLMSIRRSWSKSKVRNLSIKAVNPTTSNPELQSVSHGGPLVSGVCFCLIAFHLSLDHPSIGGSLYGDNNLNKSLTVLFVKERC